MPRIYTAEYLVPCDAPPIPGGALLDVDGTIAAVGRREDLLRANPGVDVVDFPDAILLPLLVNAHTHLELTDFPLWAQAAGETDEPDEFVDWILRLIRTKKTLGKKHYHQSLENGIAKSLSAGTGAVGDILSQYASRKLYAGSPLRGVLFLESLGHDPEIISRIRLELRSILAEEESGHLRLGLSPHSPYTISADYLEEIYSKCRKQKLPCTTHVAESPSEVDFLQQSSGPLADRFYPFVNWEYLLPPARNIKPADYLDVRGGLFTNNLLVHGVQLTAGEISLLAKKQMSLALCPRSNAKLGVGKAPVAELVKQGVSLCLGTDSMASNSSLSMWDEIAFAHSWFDGQLDAPGLIAMGTVQGAKALGLGNQLGSLSCQKLSSFQVLQPDEKINVQNLYDYLVSQNPAADIEAIYHDGQPYNEEAG